MCFYLIDLFSLYTLWSFIFLFTLHNLKRNETNKWRWTPLQQLFSFYYWRVHSRACCVYMYVCVCSRHNHLSKPVGRITRCLLYSISSVITWLYDSTKLYITCVCPYWTLHILKPNSWTYNFVEVSQVWDLSRIRLLESCLYVMENYREWEENIYN